MDNSKIMSYSSKQTRLHSFFCNPLPTVSTEQHQPSSMKLAEAGFERKQSSSSNECAKDEVYCRFCGLKYSGWARESPLAVHRTLRPNCPFLNTPPTKPSQTYQNSLFGSRDAKDEKMDSSKFALILLRRQIFSKVDELECKMKKLPEIQYPFQPKRGDFLMLFESHRLLTFKNPDSYEAAIYAKAGFIYDDKSICAICIFCNVEVEFKTQEQISLEFCHKEQSPSCPFICDYDVGNISFVDERLIREKERITFFDSCLNEKEEGKLYSVQHPEYKATSSRCGTFESWPVLQASVFPPELMVECGFYFTNIADSVRCFSCGVGLRGWSKGADPFAQHAKASPNCWHILNVKGQEFVDVARNIQLIIQVDHRETQDALEPETAATPSTSSSPCASNVSPSWPSSMTVGSPHLDMDSIKAAMACQYTIPQIADAVIKFFVISSGRYPNKELLLGTLRAADVNHKVICEQQQDIINKESELEKTKTELHSQRKVNEVTKSELARTWQFEQQQSEVLQHKDEVIHHKDEVIHQKDEMLYQKDEVIYQKDEVIYQKDEALQHNAIELEFKNKEVDDLRRQLKSALSALEKKEKDDVKENEVAEANIESKPVNEDEFPVANCKVCLTNTAQVVLYPCKHLCCCDTCASRLYRKNCPICREPNLTMEKVYLS